LKRKRKPLFGGVEETLPGTREGKGKRRQTGKGEGDPSYKFEKNDTGEEKGGFHEDSLATEG